MADNITTMTRGPAPKPAPPPVPRGTVSRKDRRAAKALRRQAGTALGVGAVAVTLTALSLSHLAHGIEIVTGCQPWEGWAMAGQYRPRVCGARIEPACGHRQAAPASLSVRPAGDPRHAGGLACRLLDERSPPRRQRVQNA